MVRKDLPFGELRGSWRGRAGWGEVKRLRMCGGAKRQDRTKGARRIAGRGETKRGRGLTLYLTPEQVIERIPRGEP